MYEQIKTDKMIMHIWYQLILFINISPVLTRKDFNKGLKLHFKHSWLFWKKCAGDIQNTSHHITTGMDFPGDYSKIPDIPQLSPELTQTFPVYTQTSPDGNPCMPGQFPDIPWGIPSLPWLPPEMPWETHVSPEDSLTSPDGHPWWPELSPVIPWGSPGVP